VEQDHRGVKRVTRPMLGFKAFDAAQSTLTGIEIMHMLRKGQLAGGREAGRSAAEQFSLWLRNPYTDKGHLPFHAPLSKICDRAFVSTALPGVNPTLTLLANPTSTLWEPCWDIIEYTGGTETAEQMVCVLAPC